MATTHKAMRLWIAQQSEYVIRMINAGDVDGCRCVGRLLAMDAFKLHPNLRDIRDIGD